MKLFLIVGVLTFYLNCSVNSAGLNEGFTWTRISYEHIESKYSSSPNLIPKSTGQRTKLNGGVTRDNSFVFPDDNPYHASPPADGNQDEEYIFENNIPMGANRWNDKLFITVPRRRLGVPSTLNYVSISNPQRHNVPLIPYPDLRTNAMRAPPGEEHLVSVYRVAVDPCDRLWMVDTGVIELPGNRTVIGPQRIVIIDLNTDKIIKTYNFKESDLTSVTTLALVTVDVTARTCGNAYAYFPDLAGYGLIVYSLRKDDSWRVNHNYFYLEPLAGDLHVGGIDFQWNDGIFSGALTGIQSDGYRSYIFHAMAGTHLYAVSTRILKNKDLATRSFHGKDFMVLGDRGENSQTSASDLHQSSGILFLALVNQNGVGCWNIKTLFRPENFGIVQKNNYTMIYPSDLKIYKDEVIVLTNTMPVFLYSKLDYDQINFRVWSNNVYDAVSGTVCDIYNRKPGGY